MPNDTIILQVSERLDIGDGVHRFHAPARAMSRTPGVTVIECDVLHRALAPLAERVDVLVLAAFNGEMMPLFERRRQAGLLTVVEANDYYPDLQSWNPFYRRWLDRTLQDSFFTALRLADGVQASTDYLARRWTEHTSAPIAVFRNHLEHVPPLPPPAPGLGAALPTQGPGAAVPLGQGQGAGAPPASASALRGARPLTIGWGGSPGHFADW
jgi:hypothetical protein